MCGITGFFSYQEGVDTNQFYIAHKKLAHRGPDDEGFIYKNDIDKIEHLSGDDTIDKLKSYKHIATMPVSRLILGHRRLSIIDLTEQGHQPFHFENFYITYNGEIFNYIELREELITLGYDFNSDSDTEVFLKAYHCWGTKSFSKFNGMWAAAIYNTTDDSLILTRDRFGIKPVYYSLVNESLIFGSEIKFINSFFKRTEANEQMVYEYLEYNHINHTHQTLFKNILQLEPGSYLIFSKKGVETKKYFTITSIESSKKIVEIYLKESIKLRMRSDVEVGSLLSGGIDSSTILGIIDTCKYIRNFQTFSAVFNEEQFSEKKYIDEFKTKNTKLKKHFIYPNPNDLADTIEDLIYTQEEPFRSLAVFSQYEIYRYIQKNTKTKVLLNGQGADEIFTGYTSYHYIYLLELLKKLKIKLFIRELHAFKKNKDISILSTFIELIKNLASMLQIRRNKNKLFNKVFSLKKRPSIFGDLLKDSLYKSLTYSALREYLRYEDKNSMRFSVESRLPFLDFRLVLSVFSLKNEDKIKDGISKYTLREIAKNKIPQSILTRTDKMGFSSPQEIWQKKILKNELDNTFKDIEKNGLFCFINTSQIANKYYDYKKGINSQWDFIWNIYMLYKWKKVWNITGENNEDKTTSSKG